MTVNSRCFSWKEFCVSKRKEKEGFLKEPMKFENPLGNSDPFACVSDPAAFSRLINLLEDEHFLLPPAGGNRVNLVHSCFKATASTDEGSLVFGILGSRRSSPFKRANVRQAVMHQASPGVTRSEGRKDNLAPSMKDFAKCACAADSRDTVAAPEGENSQPDEILGRLPSSCFVHRSVFEIFGNEGSMRAGELAMRALDNFAKNCEEESEEEEEDGDPEKRTQHMLFLWSVENLGMTKVNLSDPPDNDICNRLAQSAMRKVDKSETPTEGDPRSPVTLTRNLSLSKSQSVSPNDRFGNDKTDRMQSAKPSHASLDGSPLAKFCDEAREKGRRGPKKGKRKSSPSPPSSDQNSGSPNESNEKGSREPAPPRKSFSKSPGSRSRSKGKSPTRSRSRSSRTKSLRDNGSDAFGQESRQTRKPKRNKSPSSSSPGSSSGDSSNSPDDSGSFGPRKGTRRPIQKKRRRRKKKREPLRKKRGRGEGTLPPPTRKGISTRQWSQAFKQ
jgi:hypothetical protein